MLSYVNNKSGLFYLIPSSYSEGYAYNPLETFTLFKRQHCNVMSIVKTCIKESLKFTVMVKTIKDHLVKTT